MVLFILINRNYLFFILGNSLIDVLFGAVNPSGKLPYTIAQNRGDYSADVIYNNTTNAPIVQVCLICTHT